MSSKVFISYRRSGDASKHVAGRIHDQLCLALGRNGVFMDSEQIPLGHDFVSHLETQLEQCCFVLAMIGPAWLDATDEDGRRRLDNPKDWVRAEIGAALRRGIPVVPVLVDGGTLPEASKLPAELAALSNRQALELTDSGFRHELARLLEDIRRFRGDQPERFSFEEWSAWGTLQMQAEQTSPDTLTVRGTTLGAAGLVIENRLPYGGKLLTLDVSGSAGCRFDHDKMFKVVANKRPLRPTTPGLSAHHDPTFIRAHDGSMSFALPVELDKLELVFWNCRVENLVIGGHV